MKKNLGIADRIIRTLLAIIIGILYFANVLTGTAGIILLMVGVIILLTAIFGFCPIYYPIKLSTLKEKKE